MTQNKLFGIGAVILAVLFFCSEIFFVVDEREKALVLQFGESKHVHHTPGLKLKIPFIQTVTKYNSRLMDYSLPVIEVTAGDQKRVVVDMYTRYRINDVLLFFKKVVNNKSAQTRINAIVDASMRRVIGRVPLSEMLSANRQKIMEQILSEVQQTATQFGIEIVDVRIIRFDLPRENSQAIFSRMESERRQEAKQFRAIGDQKAQEIRANTDRQTIIIIAEAKKNAEITRGLGDAEATRIYAEAYNQDPVFYSFSETLQAYENSFKVGDTTFLLSPDHDFLKFFNNPKQP